MSDIGKKLVVISGPSGAGKDTIAAELLAMDEKFSLSVSATTRRPRKGEVNGINYYFLSEEDFVKKIGENAFVEYAKYSSCYYGTLKSDVKKRIDNGKIIILVIDVQGAENIKKQYPDSTSVFIMPPSEDVLKTRLRNRMTECEEDILKRIEIAKGEMKKSCNYDFVVINDKLDKAVYDVYGIINKRIR